MAETEPKPKRHILIPMDESEHSQRAFDYYMKHVHRADDYVILLYVHEYHNLVSSPMAMTDVAVMAEMMQQETARMKEFATFLSKKLKEIGGKVITKSGKPGEVIVSESREKDVAMIIMGSRGQGTIRRTFMGSVSDYVMHHSHIPVLVVKPEEHHH